MTPSRFYQTSFIVLCLILIAPMAIAQDGSFMGITGSKDYIFSLQHLQMFSPSSSPDIQVQEQTGYANIPLVASDSSAFSVITRGKRAAVNVPLTFPDRNTTMPQEFGTLEGGLAWSTKESNGDKFGASGTYGSAGTNLFENGYTPIITGSGFWEATASNGNSWIFSLNYSNNRTFLNNIPIPGVAYSVNGDNYKFIFGIPIIFVNWRPDPFSLTVFATVFSAMADISCRVYGPIQLYVNGAWQPKAYQNLIKDESKDRLLFDEKLVSAGLKLFLGPQTNFSVGYIYAFQRRFIIGQSIFSHSSNPIALGDGNGFVIKGQVAF